MHVDSGEDYDCFLIFDEEIEEFVKLDDDNYDGTLPFNEETKIKILKDWLREFTNILLEFGKNGNIKSKLTNFITNLMCFFAVGMFFYSVVWIKRIIGLCH